MSLHFFKVQKQAPIIVEGTGIVSLPSLFLVTATGSVKITTNCKTEVPPAAEEQQAKSAQPPPQAEKDKQVLANHEATTSFDTLTPTDLAMFAGFGIPPELVKRAQIKRVTTSEANTDFHLTFVLEKGNKDGLMFSYFHPGATSFTMLSRLTLRLRRDVVQEGEPKYLCNSGDVRHLYFVPGCAAEYLDATCPVVLVEAEKSALALTALAERQHRKILPVATGGCWSWLQKVEVPDGEEKSVPLADLDVCRKREVFVMLDSNAKSNPNAVSYTHLT